MTLEPLPKEALVLTEEDLRGAGLTAAEIAASPEIGSWAEDREMPSGAEYVEHLRAASLSKRLEPAQSPVASV